MAASITPKTIDEVRSSILTVPWASLAHAYHGAGDAPAKLRVFVDATAPSADLKNAVDWMWASVLHQGSIYSASIPTLWILTDLLVARPNHPAGPSILYGVQTMARALGYFENATDEADESEAVRTSQPGDPAYEAWTATVLPDNDDDDYDDESEYFTATRVRIGPVRALVSHALPLLDSLLDPAFSAEQTPAQTRLRGAAFAAALSACLVMPAAAAQLARLPESIGDPRFATGDWVSAGMVFGELGHDFRSLLGHDDRRVRLSAAMAQSSQGDVRRVEELASALAEPDWLEAAFPDNATHVPMHLRFHVLAALLARGAAQNAAPSVIEALCVHIDQRAGRYTVDSDWGPILHWAFKDRLVARPFEKKDSAPLPVHLTAPQRAILRSVCDKAELWDPTNGNASLMFKKIQLPYSRDDIAELLVRTDV